MRIGMINNCAFIFVDIPYLTIPATKILLIFFSKYANSREYQKVYLSPSFTSALKILKEGYPSTMTMI